VVSVFAIIILSTIGALYKVHILALSPIAPLHVRIPNSTSNSTDPFCSTDEPPQHDGLDNRPPRWKSRRGQRIRVCGGLCGKLCSVFPLHSAPSLFTLPILRSPLPPLLLYSPCPFSLLPFLLSLLPFPLRRLLSLFPVSPTHLYPLLRANVFGW